MRKQDTALFEGPAAGAPQGENHSIKVIGHLHPDTDSICSAIAYSVLKAKLDPEHSYEACRAGILSRETEFVLKYFGAEPPRLYSDVSPQINDVDYRRMEGVDASMSLRRAWSSMEEVNVDTLCVVDEENRLKGVITIRDMTRANMDMRDDDILARAGTSYQNIAQTLNATVLAGSVEGKKVTGRVVIGAGSAEMIERSMTAGDVAIVSNRSDSQLSAIEMHAGCIVVCADAKVSHTICMLAEERGCVLMSTPYSTYEAVQTIVQASPIGYYMVSENLLTFTPETALEAAIKTMASVRYRYFPILDEEGRLLGVVSRRNLLNYRRKQLILVDHNERTQAVDGLDSAEVLEIIDHHRISALETESPVYFRNVPVGCTCTIVYQMYRENGVEIGRQEAGLMLSAILSDTLMFRSPTCTPVDKAAAEELAKLAGVEIESYAAAMFEAGGDTTGKTADEIVNTDYKLFAVGDVHFGVAQNNYMTQKSRRESEELVAPSLSGTLQKQGLRYIFCMFTDVLSSTTELMMAGDGAEELVHRAFGVEVKDGMATLQGVVSRKKQLVPALLGTIKQMAEEG